MDLEISAAHYNSSKATRTRRNRKRQLKGGRPGNQGNFHGARQDYLLEHVETFVNIKGAGRATQKNFWEKLYAGYWSQWPWYVPPDKEPDEGLWQEPDTTDPDNLQAKGDAIKLIQDQIQNHMRHLRNNYLRPRDNIWAPLLQELRERAHPPAPPRMLADWQLYMSKKTDEIQEAFDDRWTTAGLGPDHVLAYRAQIARELLAQESAEFKTSLVDELKAMHEVALADFDRETMPAWAAMHTEQTRQSAQDNIATIVQPLLELIREYTGYYITLIAGIPMSSGDRDFKLKILNAGKVVAGQEYGWHEIDAERFKTDVMGSFTRFLMQTPEYAARTASATMSTAPLQPSSSILSPLGLPLAAVGIEQENEVAAGGKRKGKGKERAGAKGPAKRKAHRAKPTSEDEAESSGLGSDRSGMEGGDGDETEDDDDDDEDEDGMGDAPLNMHGIPEEVDLCTAEELDMGSAIAGEIAGLSSDKRRIHLHRFAQLSEYDRGLLRSRADAAALLNVIQPTPIPLWLYSAPAKWSSQRKQGGRKAVMAVALPVRKSSRLNPAPSTGAPVPSSSSNCAPTSLSPSTGALPPSSSSNGAPTSSSHSNGVSAATSTSPPTGTPAPSSSSNGVSSSTSPPTGALPPSSSSNGAPTSSSPSNGVSAATLTSPPVGAPAPSSSSNGAPSSPSPATGVPASTSPSTGALAPSSSSNGAATSTSPPTDAPAPSPSSTSPATDALAPSSSSNGAATSTSPPPVHPRPRRPRPAHLRPRRR
ncbi:hypothetical protein C2E23DRAFT_882800 [Lenzites betulinus]|nr:hypothetical protein C2E23DRAFT_882800 [Lenzites betulinus]